MEIRPIFVVAAIALVIFALWSKSEGMNWKKTVAITGAAVIALAVCYFAGSVAGADPMPLWGKALWGIIYTAFAALIGALFLAMTPR